MLTCYPQQRCRCVEIQNIFRYIVDKFHANPNTMVTHYFTLRVLCQELNALLQGATIDEIFTQQKNELIISLGRPARTEAASAGSRFLSVSVDPKLNYIFSREKFARAKKNSADLFKE